MKTGRFFLVVSCAMLLLLGCIPATTPAASSALNTDQPIRTHTPELLTALPTPTIYEPVYAFPEQIDPGQSYLFYLHGKIIEDQGIPAISPDFGEYQYFEILERLSGYGFVVISEQRSKNTDSLAYASKIASQAKELLAAGVPAKNITLVGASKGAGIVIHVSHLLENEAINFVILAICHPDTVEAFKQDQIHLYGNVLSIYDSSDDLAGSCQALFEFSEGKGLARVEEVVLKVGTGHGILFQPLDEWVFPTIHWAGKGN